MNFSILNGILPVFTGLPIKSFYLQAHPSVKKGAFFFCVFASCLQTSSPFGLGLVMDSKRHLMSWYLACMSCRALFCLAANADMKASLQIPDVSEISGRLMLC